MQRSILIRNHEDGCRTVNADGSVFFVSMPARAVLEELCLAHGSTMQGRVDAFKKLTGSVQKAAVLISETDRTMYFPTRSSENSDCEWILYNDILDVKSTDNASSEIIFLSGYRYVTQTDMRTIKKQMKRCEAFLTLLCREKRETDILSSLLNAAIENDCVQ